MKKSIILVAILATVSLVSCKKDYTCECTTSFAGITASASTTIKETKKKATEACEAGSSSATIMGETSTTTCKIK